MPSCCGRAPSARDGLRATADELTGETVSLSGVITASIASWLIDRVRETEESIQAATRDDALALALSIEDLKATITSLAASQNADWPRNPAG